MKKIVSVVVLILLIAGAAFWYQGQLSKPTTASPAPNIQTGQKAGNTIEGGNAVNVGKQDVGDMITADLVVLSEPGFVVIHKADAKGVAGDVLGYSDYLTAGQHTDVAIELEQASKQGDMYVAMLHRDNGDKDFTTEEDKSIKDNQGNDVNMKFEIMAAVEQPED